jgi:hypothetical protein
MIFGTEKIKSLRRVISQSTRSEDNATHSILLSWTVRPLRVPRIRSSSMSFTWLLCTKAGPTGQAPSNDLE